jgi:hypothetical protein
VEFNIRDGSEAAAKSGRRYTMLVDTNGHGTFQIGDKVPYATGSFQPGIGGTGINPAVNTQYSYLDTGVNIDCHLRESNGKVALSAQINVATVTRGDKNAATDPPNPTVASIHIGVSALLNAGKPALLASINDPVTMRKFDVEVTLTKAN